MVKLAELARFRSIKGDFLLFTIPILILGFFLNDWIATQILHEALLDNTQQEMNRGLEEVRRTLADIDEHARRDMQLAMQNPYFYEYFDDSIHLAELASDAPNRPELVAQQRAKRGALESMATILQDRFHIVEACLIDQQGHEHLRVVRGGAQPEEKFSTNEQDVPFFKTAFTLAKGEVARSLPYISPDANEWVQAYFSPVVMPDGRKPAFFHFEIPLRHMQNILQRAGLPALGERLLSSYHADTNDLQIVVNRQGLLLFNNKQLFSYTLRAATAGADHDHTAALADYLPNANTLFRGAEFQAMLAKMQAGQMGMEHFREENKQYLIIFRDLPEFDWSVASIRAVDNLLTGKRALSDAWILLAGVGTSIVILAILFIILGSGRVIRPLRELTRSADAISIGQLDCLFTTDCAQHEIHSLAKSLRTMCEALRIHQQGLQQTIDQRTENLQMTNAILKETIVQMDEANKQAVAANESKSLFVANMSHEIRTPMNAIMGLTYLCLQTTPTTRQKDYLDKIYGAAGSLRRIVDDILDFSKLEAGKMTVESISFRLDTVLQDLSTLITVKAHEKNLEVVFVLERGVPQTLLGDPTRLGQVLTNLANNAVKFTKSGEIVISVKRTATEQPTPPTPPTETATKDDITLQFAVKDSGIGLTIAQQKRLFQAFSQADGSTTRQYGGTGLGLTISKRLVELMGGTIWVESTPEQGSTFLFTARFGLPTTARKKCLQLPDNLQHKRVLIIDDNLESQKMLQTALQSFSFQVAAVPSGMAGLTEMEKARQENQPYELLLLDWHMPDLDGAKTLLCLKSLHQPFDLPILFMVPHHQQAQVKQNFGPFQPQAYLDKPVQLSILFDTVMNVFGYKELLPVAQSLETAQSLTASRALSGAKILLVEDNEINQQVGKELLAMMGAVVEIANDGQEAIQMLTTSEFDLVLMDIQMPIMDGYQTTQAIRMLPQYTKLPIVAMTANAMVQDLARCWEVGMDDHIAKPVDPTKLFRVLNKWLRHRENQTIPVTPVHTTGPTTQEIMDWPELPGIDRTAALFQAGGSTKLLRSLLGKFATHYAHFPIELQATLDQGNMEQAKRLAHTLKGVAGTIGATRLQHLAKDLETTLATSPDFLAELNLVLASSTQGSRVTVTPLNTPQTTPFDPSLLRQTLETLKPHLEKRRPKNCEPILEQLAQMTLPPNLTHDLEGLAKLIRTYKLKEALPILETIINRLHSNEAPRGENH